MSLPIIFRRVARREFDEAADWYEQRCPRLGMRFVAAVQHVLDEAAANSARYPAVFGDVREGVVRGFPYCVYYRDEGVQLLVLAVFHASRDPAIWQSRA
jgi:plasmid stabilization system protein ParE